MSEEQQPEDERSVDEALTGDPSEVQSLALRHPFLPSAALGGSFPVAPPRDITPLDDDEHESAIPPGSLWAMKDRRHEQLLHPFGHPARLRVSVGTGDATVYAIDDGARHCVIGHRVGKTPDGCVYTLVGRVRKQVYGDLAAGIIDGRHAFSEAKELALLGTGEEPGMANVFDVAFYDGPADVPAEYLPPSPFIDFTEDLPSSDR